MFDECSLSLDNCDLKSMCKVHINAACMTLAFFIKDFVLIIFQCFLLPTVGVIKKYAFPFRRTGVQRVTVFSKPEEEQEENG